MTVSLSPLAGAGWQFCDENGNPLSGGLLYTYQAGTTTPSPTYTTNVGNVTNTNPIVLDSAGRPPNEVWLVSTDSYKFALKTSTGIDVWTQDNIYGVASSALIEGLSGANGSNLIGFTQSGAGAVTRTVQTKLREWVSITDYGASPSATTAVNDGAIQAAMTEANVRKCAVYVPGANSAYRVSDEFTIPSGVTVWGDGYSSLIQQTIAGKNIFIAGNDSVVRDLHLKMCAGNNLNIAKQNCVAIGNVRNVKVINNWLELVDTNSGVYIAGAKDVTVDNNIIYGATWNGSAGAAATVADILLYSSAASGRYIITNNYCLSNNSQGIYANALGYDAQYIIANNIVITLDPSTCTSGGTWSEIATGGIRRHGIMVQYSNDVGGLSPGAVVTGNLCRNTRWTGIYAQGDKNNGAVITNNICTRNGYQLGNPLSGGIYVTVSGFELIADNYIYEYQNTSASGAITLNAVSTPTRRAQVKNNSIQNSAGFGMYLSTQVANLDIAGNTFYNNTLTDIVWVPNAGQPTLGGFYITDNTITRLITNTSPAITFSTQVGVVPSYIIGNKIYGFDNTTVNALNNAIRVTSTNPTTIIIRDNYIDKFYYGVYYTSYFAASTRFMDFQLEGNTIVSCNTGIVAAATSNTVTVPLTDNRFISVTTPTSAGGLGSLCGYLCSKVGTRIIAQNAAAPAVGTWAVADQVLFTAPASGGYIGAVCTVAGTPGTWRSFGLIA